MVCACSLCSRLVYSEILLCWLQCNAMSSTFLVLLVLVWPKNDNLKHFSNKNISCCYRNIKQIKEHISFSTHLYRPNQFQRLSLCQFQFCRAKGSNCYRFPFSSPRNYSKKTKQKYINLHFGNYCLYLKSFYVWNENERQKLANKAYALIAACSCQRSRDPTGRYFSRPEQPCGSLYCMAKPISCVLNKGHRIVSIIFF